MEDLETKKTVKSSEPEKANGAKDKTKLYFILSSILLAAFLLLIVLLKTVDVKAVTLTGSDGTFDTEIGLAGLNIAVSNAIKFNSTWYKITGVLGILPLIIACAFVVFGVVQLVMRKSLKRVDGEIYLLGGLYVLTFIIYIFFEKVIINYRPVILYKAPEASFPSSHTVLSLVICMSASFMLEKYVKKQAVLHGMQIALGALAVFIVLGRILAGVHWLTDILGGLLISLALYYAFKALNLKFFGNKADFN